MKEAVQSVELKNDAVLDGLSQLGFVVRDYARGILFSSTVTGNSAGFGVDSEPDHMDLVHPDDRDKFRVHCESVAKTSDKVLSVDIRLRAPEGGWRWIRHRSIRVEGQDSLILGTDVDVSELINHGRTINDSLAEVTERYLQTEMVRSIGASLVSELDPDRTIGGILSQAEEIVPFEKAVVWSYEGGALRWVGGRGRGTGPVADVCTDDARVARIIAEHLPLLVREAFSIHPLARRRRRSDLNWIGCPLVRKGQTIGIIEFMGGRTHLLGEEHLWPIMVFSEHVSIALANALKFHEKSSEADTDWLTGLPSRRSWERSFSHYTEHKPRHEKSTLLLVDVDGFKTINDTFGHAEGDRVLKAIGSTIAEAVRSLGLCGRWGGDEFAAILPGAGVEEGRKLAERIRQTVAEQGLFPDPGIEVTVSIGVAGNEGRTDMEELFALADRALYKGKRHGRNIVCCSESPAGQSVSK